MLDSLGLSSSGSMLEEVDADHWQLCINRLVPRRKWLRVPGNDRLQGWKSTT